MKDDDDSEPAHGTFDEDEDKTSMKITQAAKGGNHDKMVIRGDKGHRTSQASSIQHLHVSFSLTDDKFQDGCEIGGHAHSQG